MSHLGLGATTLHDVAHCRVVVNFSTQCPAVVVNFVDVSFAVTGPLFCGFLGPTITSLMEVK